MRRTEFWVMTGILLGMLGGCGQEGSQERVSAGPGDSEIRIQVPFAHIPGLTATLEISGVVGTFPMSVNTDGTVSVTVPAIPIGWRTFTITYYATFNGSQVILARASTAAEVLPDQTITVVFSPQDLNRNFDSDGDGWTNLAELLCVVSDSLTSNPLSAGIRCPSEDPRFAVLVAGGTVQSASYTTRDSAGEVVQGGLAAGGSFTMRGGFQAYP